MVESKRVTSPAKWIRVESPEYLDILNMTMDKALAQKQKEIRLRELQGEKKKFMNAVKKEIGAYEIMSPESRAGRNPSG